MTVVGQRLATQWAQNPVFKLVASRHAWPIAPEILLACFLAEAINRLVDAEPTQDIQAVRRYSRERSASLYDGVSNGGKRCRELGFYTMVCCAGDRVAAFRRAQGTNVVGRTQVYETCL